MDLEFLLDLGYVGLFIGTFIAATVVPFSSDFLIVGILIAGGDPLISWICATAGNWLGGLTSYWIIGLGFYKLHFGRCALFMLIGKGTRFAFWLALYYIFGDSLPVLGQ